MAEASTTISQSSYARLLPCCPRSGAVEVEEFPTPRRSTKRIRKLWHDTPFEESLMKALSNEKQSHQRKVCRKLIQE